MTSPGGAGQINFGTNISSVAREIVSGLEAIDSSLSMAGSKGGRSPLAAATAAMEADLARLRGVAESELAAVETRLQQTASKVAGSNAKLPAGGENLSAAAKPVIKDLAAQMESVVAGYVKAYGDSTGEMRAAGQRAGAEALQQVNGFYSHLTNSVTELAQTLKLPPSKLVGRTDLGKTFEQAELRINQLEQRLQSVANAAARTANVPPTGGAGAAPPPPPPPRTPAPPAAAPPASPPPPKTPPAAAAGAAGDPLPSRDELAQKYARRAAQVEADGRSQTAASDEVVKAERGFADGLQKASDGARRLNITLEQAAALVDRGFAQFSGNVYKIPGSGIQNTDGTGVVGEYHQIVTEPKTKENPNPPAPYLQPLTRTYDTKRGPEVTDDRVAIQRYEERILNQRSTQDQAALRESKAQDENEMRARKQRAAQMDRNLAQQLQTPRADGSVGRDGKPIMQAQQVGRGNSNLFDMQGALKADGDYERVLVSRTKLGVEQIQGDTRLYQANKRLAAQTEEEAKRPRGLLAGTLSGLTSRGFNGGGGASIGSSITDPDERGLLLGNIGGTAGTLLKYQALSVGIGAVTGALSSEAQQVAAFSASLTDLQIAFGKTGDLSQGFIGDLGELARVSGSSVTDAMNAAARGIRAFSTEGANADEIGSEFAKTASQLALVTGGALKDKSGDLIASASAYNIAPQNQSQILDAVAYAKKFGGDPNQISQGLANFAGVGASAGFNPVQSAGLVSLVSARNDETGPAAATRLSRMLATLQGTAAKGTLNSLGVNTAGTPAQVLENTIAAYGKLGRAQQQQILIAVGGQAQQRETTAVFAEGARVLADTADSSKAVGAGEEEARKHAASLVGVLKELSADYKAIQTGVFQTDIFAPLVGGLRVLEPALHILAQAIELFNELTRLGDGAHLHLSLVSGLAIDVAAAVILYRKLKAAREAAAASAAVDEPVQRLALAPQPGRTSLPILSVNGIPPHEPGEPPGPPPPMPVPPVVPLHDTRPLPANAGAGAGAAAAAEESAALTVAHARTGQSAEAAAAGEDRLAASWGRTALAAGVLSDAQQRVAQTSEQVDLAMAESQVAYDRLTALQASGVATAQQLEAARLAEAAADVAVTTAIAAFTDAETALELAQTAATASAAGETNALELLIAASESSIRAENGFQLATDASTASVEAKTAAVLALSAAQAEAAVTSNAPLVPMVAPPPVTPTMAPARVVEPAPLTPAFSTPAEPVVPVAIPARPSITSPFSEPAVTAPPVLPTAPIVPATAVAFTEATQGIPVRAPITESVVPAFRQPSNLPQQLRAVGATSGAAALPPVEPALIPIGRGGPSEPLFPSARNVRSASDASFLETQAARRARIYASMTGPAALPLYGNSVTVAGAQTPALEQAASRRIVSQAEWTAGLAQLNRPALEQAASRRVVGQAEWTAGLTQLSRPRLASGMDTEAGLARISAQQAERARLAQAMTVSPNLLTNTYVGPSMPLSAAPLPINTPEPSPFLTRAGAGQVLPISDAERAATGNVLTGPAAMPFAGRSVQVASAYPAGTAEAGAARLTAAQVQRARQLAVEGPTVNPNLLTNTYYGPNTPLAARPLPITTPAPSPFLVPTGPGASIVRSEPVAEEAAAVGPAALPVPAARSVVVARGADPAIAQEARLAEQRAAFAAELEQQRLAQRLTSAPPFTGLPLRTGDIRAQLLRSRGAVPYNVGLEQFAVGSGLASAYPRPGSELLGRGPATLPFSSARTLDATPSGLDRLAGRAELQGRGPATLPFNMRQVALPSEAARVVPRPTAQIAAEEVAVASGPALVPMVAPPPVVPRLAPPKIAPPEPTVPPRVVPKPPVIPPELSRARLDPAAPYPFVGSSQYVVPPSDFRVQPAPRPGLFSRMGSAFAPLGGGPARAGSFRQPELASATNPFGKIAEDATNAQREHIGKLRDAYQEELKQRRLGSLSMRELAVRNTGNFEAAAGGLRGAFTSSIGAIKAGGAGLGRFLQSGMGLAIGAIAGAVLIDKVARSASEIYKQSGRTGDLVEYGTSAGPNAAADRQSATDLLTQAKKTTDASGGIIGSSVNYILGDPAGNSASLAKSQAAQQSALAARIDDIHASAALDPSKNPADAFDLSVSTGAADGLKLLADSGRNAEVQFDALIGAFQRLGQGAVDAAGRLTGPNEQIFEANLGFNVSNTIAGGANELDTKRSNWGAIEDSYTPDGIPDWLKGGAAKKDEVNRADRKKLDSVDTKALNNEINKQVAASGQNVGTPEGKAAIEKLVRNLVSNAIPELQDKDLRNGIINNAVSQVGTTANPLLTPPTLGDALQQLRTTAPAAYQARADRRSMLTAAGMGTDVEMSQGADLAGAQSELQGAEEARQTAIDTINAANEKKTKNDPSKFKPVDPNDPRLEAFNDAVTAAHVKANAATLATLDNQAAVVDAAKGPDDEVGALQRKSALIDAKIAANKDPATDLKLQADKLNNQRAKVQQALAAAASATLAAVDPRDKVGLADAAATNADAALNNVIAQLKAAGVAESDYSKNDVYNQAVIADNNAHVSDLQIRLDESAALAVAQIDSRDKAAVLAAQIKALDDQIAADKPGSAKQAQDQNDQDQKRRDLLGIATARSNAQDQLNLKPGDTLGADAAAVTAATRTLNDGTILQFGKDGLITAEYLQQQKVVADAQAKQAADTRAAADAQAAALVQPGDNVAAAQQALDQANHELTGLTAGNADYAAKQREIADKERALAQTQLASTQLARTAGIDRTNSVTVALDDLNKAKEKQALDIKQGLGKDTLNQDKIDVGDLAAKADAAQFSQNLSDAQIADQLGRSSHATYLQYLKGQHDRLTSQIAGMKSTDEGYRQAIDQLNQIDQLQKDAAANLQGQFNLGDIKLPSVYEVRRSLQQDAMATSGSTANSTVVNNTISINGADTAEVKRVITGLLGPTAISRTPTLQGAKL